MLLELTIKNFAIIHELILKFNNGLVVFTGETGAGKSIILDALEAVLGGRLDASSVRTGAVKASIEATFVLEGETKEKLSTLLAKEDLEEEPGLLTLARELRVEGRNIARVNGHSVNVGLQREIGTFLVDIHGQSEHLSLLKVPNHLELLDQYANDTQALADYKVTYHEYHRLQQELVELRSLEEEAARKTDLLTYQINEIESARLSGEEEEEELRQERTRLANAEALSTLSQQAIQLLEEGSPESPSISDLLGELSKTLKDLEHIDQSAVSYYERADAQLDSLTELSRDLLDYSGDIEFNPTRLVQIEERIDLINRLKRKYGGNVDAVLSFLAKSKLELDNVSHLDDNITKLENKISGLEDVMIKKGLLLSELRKTAAKDLATRVEQQLNDLHMKKAKFAIDFTPRGHGSDLVLPDGRKVKFDANGLDHVEFLVEPNPGEGLKPLVKIASGGETSRLMLALKNVLATADAIPVLVFDEIDQGIGGRVGLVVGNKLWELGQNHQVMCVTHLPQLAAYGDQHFHVDKVELDGRTQTIVEELNDDARKHELAQMLGVIGQNTLQSAEEMLSQILASKGKITR